MRLGITARALHSGDRARGVFEVWGLGLDVEEIGLKPRALGSSCIV